MRRELLLATLLAFAELSGSTPAQTRSDLAQPVFHSSEVSTIARNDLLLGIVTKDPWLVRRILDAMATREGESEQSTLRSLWIDPARNPDLSLGPRTAADAVEWIDLMKRAKAEKIRGSDAPGMAPDTRSAEGSIELIEIAKQLKAQKAGK